MTGGFKGNMSAIMEYLDTEVVFKPPKRLALFCDFHLRLSQVVIS